MPINSNETNTTNAKDKKHLAPFGSWKSPIDASMLTKANKGFSEPHFDGDNIYWLESRPLEKGRACIVKLNPTGKITDALPAPLNARSRVNEYGGGSYCVHQGIIYFVLFDDQRIYSLDTTQPQPSSDSESTTIATPTPLTPDNSLLRFGDLTFDQHNQRILAVCEDHSDTTKKEPSTTLVAININHFPNNNNVDDKQPLDLPTTLVSGDDFYSNPSVSPDGKKISWLSWCHPNMPWDNTTCWIANININGKLSNIKSIAGGENESIFQPTWSPDNILYFSSDKDNWWNIYRYREDNKKTELMYKEDAEYATPQWVFGLSVFGFIDKHTVLTTYTQNGLWFLATIDTRDNTKKNISTELTDIGYVNARNGKGIFIGSNSTQFESLYLFEKNTISTLSDSSTMSMDSEFLASPEPITFPTTSLTSLSKTNTRNEGYAFFYPPQNTKYTAEKNQLPPLLVFCHGGPTAATHSSLNLKIQYWTSRGFAVADINYGGSTGYGRHYRDRLKNNWGLVDVQDAIDCVNYLAKENKIDVNKTAIRGGSAGGYTVLSALTFHDVFKAGTSLYGIGDLETLATDTHKFESRYLDQLVGPYPKEKQLYQDRSPIHFVERLNCPVLFLQGLKDKVVPPNQAEAMVAALDKQKISVAYVTFAEEGHGFRQAENIQRALEAELYFYSKVFEFALPEEIPPIKIKNI